MTALAGDRTSTNPPDDGLRAALADRRFRRIGTGVLMVFITLGITGFLGVRTRTVETMAGGTRVSISYPHITRSGLAVRWRLTMRRAEGFRAPITITNDVAYFDLFDFNDMAPNASLTATDDKHTILEFDPPEGTVFSLSYDIRVEPGVQWGRSARTRIAIGDELIADLGYRTWVLP